VTNQNKNDESFDEVYMSKNIKRGFSKVLLRLFQNLTHANSAPVNLTSAQRSMQLKLCRKQQVERLK